MMEKYWLYLESYVFLWTDENNIILYNSLSKESYLYQLYDSIKEKIEELINVNNLYSISIDSKDMSNSEFSDFIQIIRSSFCGDIVNIKLHPQKPVVIYPLPNINDDVNRLPNDINNNEVIGNKVLNNLTDISIYLGGECSKKCSYCSDKYKQIKWCNKSIDYLDFKKLCGFLKKLKNTNIDLLSIYGGNIFSYPFFDKLLIELKKYQFHIEFNIDYNIILENTAKFNEIVDLKFGIKVLVGDTNFKSVFFNKHFTKSHKYHISVENSKEFYDMSNFLHINHLNKSNISPYYTIKNLDFFQKYVFQNKEDILSAKLSRNNIFSRQILNENFFGKIILFNDGYIYTNLNGKPIGKIDDNLKELVYNEIKNGFFWRKTRDTVKPCNNCIYKYLCPSPSNYDFAIGKSNLCHIK